VKSKNSVKKHDFEILINKAIHLLKDGEKRLNLSIFNSKMELLRDFTPDISDTLASDYGISSSNKSLEANFFEEINLIEKLLEESRYPIELADWQKSSENLGTEKIYKKMNRRSYALQIWSFHAIPWRFDNDLVHLIWAPEDVMGTPIIMTFEIEYFLSRVSNRYETQYFEIIKKQKQLEFWMKYGIILTLVLLILLSVFFKI
jgi:hypothetical protein